MAKHNKRYYLKKSLLWLGVITVLVLVSIGLVFTASNTHQQVASIVSGLSSFESMARFVRWGLLGALIMFWEQAAAYIVHLKSLDEEQHQRLLAMKWRVALFILAFELLVVEAVPAKLMG